MFKFVNYFKNNALIISVVAVITVFCLGITLIVLNSTYALPTYTIVFNRAEGNEVMLKCETDVTGKLEQSCANQIGIICSSWSSKSMYEGQGVNTVVTAEAFKDMSFNEKTIKNYYCLANSSTGKYDTGCYQCIADKSIVHWAASAAGNDACPGGYTYLHKDINNCKVYACYECSDNNRIMKWHYTGLSDDNCPAGYNKTTKTQEECKYVEPDACYQCKDNDKVFSWKNNGEADNNCSAGYNKTTKTQEECKYVEPEPNACYVCKNNDNVFSWKNNGNADNNCSAGYNKTDLPIEECKPIDNPKTGDITIFLVWVLGIGCLVYSLYYFKISMIKD